MTVEHSGRDDAFWKHVANLRPRLRRDVQVLVQDYREERWYLLHDRASGRFLRFNHVSYEFIGRLDGDLTVGEILEIVNAGDTEEPLLLSDQVLQIMAQLHAAEVLRGGLPLGVQDLLNRHEQALRYRRRRALSNPLALRIPIFDPNRLLGRLMVPARWLFSWAGFSLWLGVVAVAAVLAVANAGELGEAIGAKTISASEVLVFWLLYPLIKALHELGHGMAVKAWGGEVHETGINLLVFMPVPYVDASAAWAFRDKRRRAIVGAAGILVEVFLAALGILVWLLVEPGLVRDMALNVALIGGVSTLLFNGNPLLRFDGYYVLEDLIEIPNLATRSSRYYQYLMQKYLLDLPDARSPVTADGETAWFLFYGLASPLYRLVVLVGIALYLAAEFLVVGVVLASWAILMQVIRPLFLSLRFIATSPRVEARRIRGAAVFTLAIVLIGSALAVPAPLVTQAQGVIWPGEQARVVSITDGFVVEVAKEAGAEVTLGDVLLRLDNPELRTRLEVVKRRLQELRNEQIAERQRSRVRAAIVADDIAAVRAEYDQLVTSLAGLEIRSAEEGRFYPADPHELIGKYLRQGDVVGYVIRAASPVVRAIVEQDRVGLLRSHNTQVEVVLAERLGQPLPAEVVREIPAGSEELPSMALGAAGGGDIAVDTRDQAGRTATEKVFQLELALPSYARATGIGGRAYVRLDHGSEPLWRQWTRSIRQLLLSRLQT